MKKLTAMLLALTLCFGLAACGGNTAQDDTKDESQTVQTGKSCPYYRSGDDYELVRHQN